MPESFDRAWLDEPCSDDERRTPREIMQHGTSADIDALLRLWHKREREFAEEREPA